MIDFENGLRRLRINNRGNSLFALCERFLPRERSVEEAILLELGKKDTRSGNVSDLNKVIADSVLCRATNARGIHCPLILSTTQGVMSTPWMAYLAMTSCLR